MPRQVFPFKKLEGPEAGGVDRIPRVNRETELAGEQAEPETIVAVIIRARGGGDRPIIIKIALVDRGCARWQAGVRRSDVSMRIIERRLPALRDREVVVVKTIDGE